MLIDGRWTSDWNPYQAADKKGNFIRQNSSFRHWITADGSAGRTGEGGFLAEPGRYHLYVALICPWASRTLMVRALKGLESVISVTIVEPRLTSEGWQFGDYLGAEQDLLHGFRHVHQLYTHADSLATGRATVPVLWDKQRDTLVNNESADIIEMLNDQFSAWATRSLNLRPQHLQNEMDALNQRLYENLNNGVYRAGFAQSQGAYDAAVENVFLMLAELEERLTQQTYLLGDQLTEADVRLFVTLARFDVAYHGLFKCNLQRISDYPSLNRYMQRIYQLPGVSSTVNLAHIKAGYYSVKALNPQGIVPLGPENIFVNQKSVSEGHNYDA